MAKIQDGTCRLCFSKQNITEMYDLFNNNDNNNEIITTDSTTNIGGQQLNLFQKIQCCSRIKINALKTLPTKICCQCLNTINNWYDFHQTCIRSQLYFKYKSSTRKSNASIYKDLKRRHLQSNSDLASDKCEEPQSNVIDFPESIYPYKNMISDDANAQRIIRNNPKISIEDANVHKELTADDFEEAMTYFNSSENQLWENYVEEIGEIAINSNKSLTQNTKPSFKARNPVVENDNPKDNSQDHEITAKHELKTGPIYMCSKCGNMYSKRSLLQYHLNTHNGLKPYQCEICQNSYRMMSELKDHMHRHTGERPFKCKYCERHFIDRGSRHRHERLHTNTRPYECQACHKRFSYSAILKNHMKLHSGEKNFKCDICNKSFTLQHQLKAHMQSMAHKRRETNWPFHGIN